MRGEEQRKEEKSTRIEVNRWTDGEWETEMERGGKKEFLFLFLLLDIFQDQKE